LIEYLSETGSTNADLAARLAAGEALGEGYWLVADRQSAGRGRLGRTWFDGTGNFMGSTIVRPAACDPSPGTLALVVGLALIEVVSGLVPPPHRAMLKWPNDVLIGTAKLTGILLERSGDAIVAGIGVNLVQAPDLPDRPAIALSAFGPAPDRNTFAEALARQFAIELDRWRSYGLEPIVARWQAAAHPPGTALVAGEPGGEQIAGSFIGLAADGALQLRLDNGTTRTIHAGEVRLAAQD
jgi:BirA family transcriptional regulator, biotin operon repressor / biotin---[acetyl-CoA-carboxylase] ligase